MSAFTRRQLIASAAIAATPLNFLFARELRGGGTIRMVSPEPTMLTGAFNSAGQIYVISAKFFDGLVTYDFDFNLKPQLAVSWDIARDGRTISFRLRPNVKWHDGTVFSSGDVAYSALQIWKTMHPRGRATYAHLEAVETPDPLTAVFRFGQPAPYAINALHSVESQIVPRHLYEGQDVASNPRNIAPVGTGPFRFVEWKRGQYVMMERNRDYWDAGKPYADKVVVRFIQDPAARSAAFEAGEIDVGGFLPVAAADARRLAALPNLDVPERGDEAIAAMAYLEFNLRRPPLDDVRVRRAIAHAIDRRALLDSVWHGFGKPSSGPISSAMAKYYAPVTMTYAFDPGLAESMLDEAGYKRGPRGIRFRLTHDPLPGSEYYARTGDYFRSAMSKIGIVVDVRNTDLPGFYKRVYDDYDFDTTNFIAFNLTDPTIGVQRFYWSKNIIKGVPFSNGSGYKNQEVDRLLEAAQVEPDSLKRYELFARFQNVVMDDLPNLPLGDIRFFSVVASRTKNVITSPFGVHDNFSEIDVAI